MHGRDGLVLGQNTPSHTTNAFEICNVRLSSRGLFTKRTLSKSLTTQSLPASKTWSTLWLVVRPMTLQSAALPALIPAGESSTTTNVAFTLFVDCNRRFPCM